MLLSVWTTWAVCYLRVNFTRSKLLRFRVPGTRRVGLASCATWLCENCRRRLKNSSEREQRSNYSISSDTLFLFLVGENLSGPFRVSFSLPPRLANLPFYFPGLRFPDNSVNRSRSFTDLFIRRVQPRLDLHPVTKCKVHYYRKRK